MEEGETIHLKNQDVEVVKCKKCDALMVNLDADQLAPGDLVILKKAGVRISNPETEDPICLNCEHQTFGEKLASWFESDPDEEDEDDDDDSHFFTPGGIFGGSSRGGGFGGGFGGFGGGGFSGGGASRGF